MNTTQIESMQGGYTLLGLIITAMVVYLAFRTQRDFWKSWLIVTTVENLLYLALTASVWIRHGILPPAFMVYFFLIMAAVEYLRNLVIYGIVRGFLCLIRQSYWKEA